MLKFNTHWTDEIRSESEKPEYMTALIRIEDPSLVIEGEYDVDTGEYGPSTGDPLIYRGRARVIFPRAGVFSGGESQSNATTLNYVRVQIPRMGEPADFYVPVVFGTGVFGTGIFGYAPSGAGHSEGRVRRSCKVFVEQAPRNPSLTGRVFNITSDIQGSSAASRTFEAFADIDAEVVA